MTDTNQASELFSLCKKVYELTGWSNETLEKMALSMADSELHAECPLYTSDYLLEKLQAISTKEPNIQNEPHILVEHSGLVKPEYRWSAKVFNGYWLEVSSTAPLKALLKLTLALHEAGELK